MAPKLKSSLSMDYYTKVAAKQSKVNLPLYFKYLQFTLQKMQVDIEEEDDIDLLQSKIRKYSKMIKVLREGAEKKVFLYIDALADVAYEGGRGVARADMKKVGVPIKNGS